MSDRRSILLLCRTERREAGNVSEHIEALQQLSRHDVHLFNPVDRPAASALLDLDEFDVVVIHYTIAVMHERYLPSVLADKIAGFGGLKVQFIQDEYRSIDAVTARMRELGIGLLFTCVAEADVPRVYGSVPGLRTVTTLPAYVPEALVGHATRPLAERAVDVGYRGREVPLWLGRLGYEKLAIGDGFAEHAAPLGLRLDISSREEDRIYGDAWLRFLSSCRATLGTESGASIADYDGSVEQQVKDHLARHPGAQFEEVEAAVLAPYEGNLTIATVSSRIFEAAALRTAMILFPGAYSGAIEPRMHYLPLERDFSNIGEIAARLRQLQALEELTGRAHADLIASGRYSLARFVVEFDQQVAEASTERAPGPGRNYARARRRGLVPPANALPLHFAANAARPAFMTALTIRDPAVRRLASPGARAGVDRSALARDLWRLAALRRGVRAGLFSASASLEDAGRRIVITTTPGPAPEGDRNGFAEALLSGRVEELVWNHTHVGMHVPLVGTGLVQSTVGSEGVPGAHPFVALLELLRLSPDEALAALEPVLRAPA